MTSVLGVGDAAYDEIFFPIDGTSASVVNDPSGFGQSALFEGARDGILGDEMPHQVDHEVTMHQPSISGALAELHGAVKNKLQSWNPYSAKASSHEVNGTDIRVNTTLRPLAGEDVKDGISEEERLGARIRIGKCTILFNGNSFWERAIRTHERHDREHGYRLHILRQHLLDDVWSKPAYILSLLLRELAKPESERLDWLLWVDADTVILNPHIPIDVFLPPPGTEFDDVHLVYSNDWNGLNNGVFPVRVNQWSVQLFSAIAAYRHFRPSDPLQFRDQSAMDTLMHEPAFVHNIIQAPQRWFNAYQGEHNETLAPFQIRRGDFLVHFAGIPAREERMGYWLERAEQHLDDWEVPVKSTSYPQEVRDFWAEQSNFRKQRKEELANRRLRVQDLIERVNQRLSEYGDRLSQEQRSAIEAQRDAAAKALEDGQSVWDGGKLEEAQQRVESAMRPLTSAMEEAQKSLLSSAHEAIFAGEKDLLDAGFSGGVRTAEMDQISESIQNLKNLVMTPQEHWNRQDIVAATNAVTEARARSRESTNPANRLQTGPPGGKTAVQSLEEIQKQIQGEADAEPQQAAHPEVTAAENLAPEVTVDPVVVTSVIEAN